MRKSVNRRASTPNNLYGTRRLLLRFLVLLGGFGMVVSLYQLYQLFDKNLRLPPRQPPLVDKDSYQVGPLMWYRISHVLQWLLNLGFMFRLWVPLKLSKDANNTAVQQQAQKSIRNSIDQRRRSSATAAAAFGSRRPSSAQQMTLLAQGPRSSTNTLVPSTGRTATFAPMTLEEEEEGAAKTTEQLPEQGQEKESENKQQGLQLDDDPKVVKILVKPGIGSPRKRNTEARVVFGEDEERDEEEKEATYQYLPKVENAQPV
eukprot:CAMPEP_0175151554 /NCGR_PEP_ID=MMETSP0087-20121206/18581_1 /TAXON_ID=136419 /ORGANISM="Unknown Unknown, Strain D1" /LENGTH=259 /DNA_ID=CAMNT_0016437805 /DNA_START=53 /DNA_END=832 /DNA_ORIENTATION=+